MTNLKMVGFGICLLGLTVSPWVHGSDLRAGVAKVDITPAPGKYMLGSGTTLATGAHDPLYARVLVLEVDQTRLALITVDLCRVFQAPLMDRLRRQGQGIERNLLRAHGRDPHSLGSHDSHQ